MTPEQHIENLEYLIAKGVWTESDHRRLHQSRWYSWKCPSLRAHINYFRRTDCKKLKGANRTYALLIQAVVKHYKEATGVTGNV